MNIPKKVTILLPIVVAGITAMVETFMDQKEAERIDNLEKRVAELEKDEAE